MKWKIFQIKIPEKRDTAYDQKCEGLDLFLFPIILFEQVEERKDVLKPSLSACRIIEQIRFKPPVYDLKGTI